MKGYGYGMKLDLIVPHYKEPWETCKYLFDSIALQRGMDMDDIKVIVVNDGNDVILDDTKFLHYPFRVDYLIKDHAGVSAARNHGLDCSDADYVMFCDIDDGFLNNYGLHLVFSAMQEEPDMVISCFVEEVLNKDVMSIVRHDKDGTFVHGKVYKREFLEKRNIRFDEDITVHEDGCFNTIAIIEAGDNIKTIGTPFYLWRWNSNSVVRKDTNLFVMRTYDQLMLGKIRACAELEKRGFVDEFYQMVCKTVFDSFYDHNKDEYNDPDNKKLIKLTETSFKRFYTKFRKAFWECNITRMGEVAVACRSTAYTNGMRVERRDIRTWLDYIERKVKL